MALYCGLQFEKPLGAIVDFSGFYLPNIQLHEENYNTPVLISHGMDDDLVPWLQVQTAFEKLSVTKPNVFVEPMPKLSHLMDVNSYILLRQFMDNHFYKVLSKKK
jgi:predicted esterase